MHASDSIVNNGLVRTVHGATVTGLTSDRDDSEVTTVTVATCIVNRSVYLNGPDRMD